MAKKKPARDYLTPPVDHGTPQRVSHGGIDFLETISAGIKVAKVRDECVLDRYYHRMQIVDRLHIAGIRLRGLWMGAAYPKATTSAYGDQRGRGGGDHAALARHALRRTLLDSRLGRLALDQPILVISSRGEHAYPVNLPVSLTAIGHIVIAVCGLDEWAGGTERLNLLRQGLTGLADHWKIAHDAVAA